jgi:hypothetical protein
MGTVTYDSFGIRSTAPMPCSEQGASRPAAALTDQSNPLKITFDCPHETDFPAALMALGWRDRARVLRDLWRFIVLYKEFRWGRQMLRIAMQRPLIGGYSMQRWL